MWYLIGCRYVIFSPHLKLLSIDFFAPKSVDLKINEKCYYRRQEELPAALLLPATRALAETNIFTGGTLSNSDRAVPTAF